MARRTRSGWGLALIALVVIVGAGWLAWQQWGIRLPGKQAPAEDALVTLSGTLHAAAPARDTQLGLEADALSLDRKVEMRQWQETCAAGSCSYALVWSDVPIDSSRFREPEGHANPRLPFASQRFIARDIRLDGHRVDPVLAVAGAASVPWPVDARQLRPNLVATFRIRDGVLFAAVDPEHPAAGDLRVSYSIVPAGQRSLSGVLEGDELRPAPR
ncbi:TMEM43 family protein [Dokdonella sp.]|uniref:TMEM43 family protein n=1 Tax=Dokdonella sp. TaxID=2291710 RepID=UPI0031BD7210|nr:TMEM43 family protein [Dokdonella sp.]